MKDNFNKYATDSQAMCFVCRKAYEQGHKCEITIIERKAMTPIEKAIFIRKF